MAGCGFGAKAKRVAAVMVVAIGTGLAGCQSTMTMPPPPPQRQAFQPPRAMALPPPREEQPNFFRLRNAPRGVTPARVALLLPFSSPSAETRGLADALEKAAELALFDSKNANILLMPRDDGGSPEKSADAVRRAIADGAEIIIGPVFAQLVSAVTPVARAEHVPVIAFSSDRSVGGNGTYLLSFQPETEVDRIVSFAARRGHSSFSALVPKSPYGDKVQNEFRGAVAQAGARIASVESFDEKAEAVLAPARAAAHSGADAVLIGEGGPILQAIGSALALAGADPRTTKFLGTGLWDDSSIQREPTLANGWFAAPAPDAFRNFSAHYRAIYNAAPPRIATLSYDAISLVALLANGKPYQRFTDAALTDPNGFAGVDGIFRFRGDGSAERGLAVLEVGSNGFNVVDPAPKTFPQAGF
jgi:ABC-type branched-subunit amino acid transport system substrate-binding protein